MSAARAEILAGIRAALADVPASERPEDVPVPRGYVREDLSSSTERVELFAQRLRDYHATVALVPSDTIAQELARACSARSLRRLAIPPELPMHWRPEGIELVEDHGLAATELDALDGAITGCATAIAQTGTIVLDGAGPCGRRALTLVPDHHICVVAEDQIAGIVPEGLAQLAETGRPITLISGPSATSDIELERVEGVHGPRTLIVLIATAT